MNAKNSLFALFAKLLVGVVTVSVFAAEPGRKQGQPFGLKRRAAWTTSRITGTLEAPPPYRAQRIAPELEFTRPVEVTSAPGSNRLFVGEVDGKIYSFELSAGEAAPKRDLFVDLTKEVEGHYRFYGMTFHPNFAENRYCFICYVQKQGLPQGTRVSRFRIAKGTPPRIVPGSEEILLTWPSGGHNGGCLKFGPDGYLYISAGDGGSSFPPDGHNTGQNVGDLRASVMRIDVDKPANGKLYRIPDDNPFVSLPDARGEIWAFGMRNPWKMSFDPATGALWVGDVGWELWELVYRVERGDNYGWSLVEGRQPVHQERQRGPTPIKPPAIEHSHIEARSITGGVVYHGKRLKELSGAYVYGDYVTGKLWAARHDGQKMISVDEIADTPLQVICFAPSADGEMLILDYSGGIYRLEKNSQAQANQNFPRKLSQTGLFSSLKDHRPAAGVIPYSIRAEMWTDGATAERFVALPGKSRLGRYDSTNVQVGYIKGEWSFPIDSVLAKTVSLELEQGNPASRRRLETQILHRHGDAWQAYNYIWNDEQTDAELAPAKGLDRTFAINDPDDPTGKRKLTWHFASRSECILCHTTRAGSVHAFNPAQLNREHDYGGIVDNQLRTLSHIGLFEQTPADDPPLMADPYDESADINDRARSYLHVNCAHCHRRGGGGSAAFDIRHAYTLKQANILDQRPTQGTFGIADAQILVPGDPYRSLLYYRMSKLARGRMPQFGSSVVDRRGLELMHDWITQLSADQPSATPTNRVASLRKQQTNALAELKSPPASDEAVDEIVARLLASPSGAMQLLREIDQQAYGPALTKNLLAHATAHPDARVRDLFERFVPEEKRVKRLGTVIDAADILGLPGDAARGRRLFFEAAGVQCKNCHKIQGMGQEIGPDLSEIGKKLDRAKLLESILQPSRQIDPKYVAHLVETTDGRVLSGLLVSKSDKEWVLRDAQNKLIRLAAAEIEFTAPQRKSLMPELLLRDMTAQEVADLLEFLARLKP